MRMKGKISTESSVQQFIRMFVCVGLPQDLEVDVADRKASELNRTLFLTTGVMHTISKINKEAVLRWAQSKLYCILTAKDIADGSVKVWGEINLVCEIV